MTVPVGYSQNSVQKQARIVGQGEDMTQKDMFLKLMLAQLKNQDPTAPMDQKDMMASITQFSQMEQMQNMATAMETLSLTQGVGMIGKQIEYTTDVVDPVSGLIVGQQQRTGTVALVHQTAGGVKLELTKPEGADPDIPGVIITPSRVTKVFGAAAA